jgi:ankyrin repeat protein
MEQPSAAAISLAPASSDSFSSQAISDESSAAQIERHGQALLQAINNDSLEEVQAALAAMPEDQRSTIVCQPHLSYNRRLAQALGSLDDLHNPETRPRALDAFRRTLPPHALDQIGSIFGFNRDNFQAGMLAVLAGMPMDHRTDFINQLKRLIAPRRSTALIKAIVRENPEIVKALLGAVPDANQRVSLVTQANEDGKTPLVWAIESNNLEIVHMLLATQRAAPNLGTIPLPPFRSLVSDCSPAMLALIFNTVPKDQLTAIINQPVQENRTVLQQLQLNEQGLLTEAASENAEVAHAAAQKIPVLLTKAGLLLAYGADPSQVPSIFRDRVVAHSLQQINQYSSLLVNPDAPSVMVSHSTHMLRWVLEKVNPKPKQERERYHQPIRQQFNQFLQGQIEKLEKEKLNVQPGERRPTFALLERTRPLLGFQKQGIQCDSKKLDALGAAAVRVNYLEFAQKALEAGAAGHEIGREIAKHSKPAQTDTIIRTPKKLRLTSLTTYK